MSIIARSIKAMDRYGWHFGGGTTAITLKDIEKLKKGKILAIDINGIEYSQFIALVDNEIIEN